MPLDLKRRYRLFHAALLGIMTRTVQPEPALIYLVDDDEMVGRVVCQLLETEGYRPMFFADPTEALEALAGDGEKPALLFTDFSMEPINGMELIEQSREILPDLPTILYSGNVGEEILAVYSIHPNAFMTKPFRPGTLFETVRNVLAAGHS